MRDPLGCWFVRTGIRIKSLDRLCKGTKGFPHGVATSIAGVGNAEGGQRTRSKPNGSGLPNPGGGNSTQRQSAGERQGDPSLGPALDPKRGRDKGRGRRRGTRRNPTASATPKRNPGHPCRQPKPQNPFQKRTPPKPLEGSPARRGWLSSYF